MKHLLVGCCLLASVAHGQTWQEWTQQKKMRKQYLLDQIAALQLYLHYTEAGFKVAQQGWNTVNAIKHGDFNLHQLFIDHQRAVNPAVKKLTAVAEIISLQVDLIHRLQQSVSAVRSFGELTPAELEQVDRTSNNVLLAVVADIDQLSILLTDGALSMSDDERMHRLETLCSSMREHYSFAREYTESMTLLSVQRLRAQSEIELSKSLR